METPHTVIAGLFWLMGGLALFLYGIELMGNALRRAAGSALRSAIDSATRTRFHGLAAGALITALVQSSSATTVMVVGFINAGLLTFQHSIGVILGANIGTTVTVQIAALHIDAVALPALGLGFLLSFISRRRVLHESGYACMGFGMLFFGLTLMKSSFAGYQAEIRESLNIFAGGGLGGMVLTFLIATAVTTLIHSSAATLVMVQALSLQSAMGLDMVIPIILGADVGSCITGILASLPSSRSAKRAAIAHLVFNLIGVLITSALYRLYLWIIPLTAQELPHQIANCHLLIKVVNVALFLPFTVPFGRLVMRLLPGEDKLNAAPVFLNFKKMTDPREALDNVEKEVKRVFGLCMELLQDSVSAFLSRDLAAQAMVRKRETIIDDLHRTIGDYLLKLSGRKVPPELAPAPPLWLHVMSDVERIGDHAENIVELAEFLQGGRAVFSEEAVEEVQEVLALVLSLAESVDRALREQREECMAEVLIRKQAINAAVDRFLDHHDHRMEGQQCSVTAGMIFVELIMNLRRVANHLRNIAASVTSRMPEHTLRILKLKQQLSLES